MVFRDFLEDALAHNLHFFSEKVVFNLRMGNHVEIVCQLITKKKYL